MGEKKQNQLYFNRKKSEEKLKSLRETLSDKLSDNDSTIVTVGSYARREASEMSDIDFFIVTKNTNQKYCAELHEATNQIFEDASMIMPSFHGAFNAVENWQDMLSNLGGNQDDTKKLTRRMLMLLESDWLYNEEFYNEIIDQFLEKYVQEAISEHQLCRFFLNDLIRYYRTIGVDFEYKTVEQDKSWGDRNIKLVFSRKFMYFSGILIAAETYQSSWKEKRRLMRRYIQMTPLERVKEICKSRSDKVIDLYDAFLEKISNHETRHALASIKKREDMSPEFRDFKNQGHHFSLELRSVPRFLDRSLRSYFHLIQATFCSLLTIPYF